MLEHRIARGENAGAGATALILLHGRGATEDDMLGLARALPADHVVIAPRAPFAAAPWGYGPGWAWYRFLGDDRVDEASFEQSQQQLAELVDGVAGVLGFEPGTVVLGGFSQGGTMSIAHAVRRPGVVPAVVNFSGFVASHPSVEATPETVRGTRFFWGHGRRDSNIPFTLAERGRALLRDAGADLTIWDGDIGHWIEPQELATAAAWIDAR